MPTITEANSFDATVYEYASTDPVQGNVSGSGLIGVANTPIQNLTNRTRWLYNQITGLINGTILPSWIAPKNSPPLTGSPTCPTPPIGDNSTKISDTQFVQETVNGVASIACAGANIILSPTQYGSAILVLSGALSAAITIIFPSGITGIWTIYNTTTGGFQVNCQVSGSSSSGIILPSQVGRILWSDGANMYRAQAQLSTAPVYVTASENLTSPMGATGAKLTLVGGGGSGAAGATHFSAGGGGGGGVGIKTLTSLNGGTDVLDIVIGTGAAGAPISGSASNGVDGSSGAATTVQVNGTGTLYVAEGGAGGQGNGNVAGGSGGSVYNCDLNLTGSFGGDGNLADPNAAAGDGAGGYLGQGSGRAGAPTGISASGFGAGGGASYAEGPAGTAGVGGNGSSGLVIVEWIFS